MSYTPIDNKKILNFKKELLSLPINIPPKNSKSQSEIQGVKSILLNNYQFVLP